MKEMFSNNPNDFSFHDSFAKVRSEGNDLIFTIKRLNVHKGTVFNPFDCDMEADTVIMELSQARVMYFKFPECSMIYPDGTKIDMPTISINDDRAFKNFMLDAEKGISINSITAGDHYLIMEASGKDTMFFEIKIEYGAVQIVWNDYLGEAWYEQDKWKNKGNIEE